MKLSDKTANETLILTARDVQKTEIWFGFGFKNRTVQKFDICSDGFPIEMHAIRHSNKSE